MKTPPAPLFRDPLHDGAADPTVIFDKASGLWWMFYTNRLTDIPGVGVSWVHGTDIGIATSSDGISWLYRGIAQGLSFEKGRNTYWAPEIIEHNGTYHMYVSYVQGIPTTWNYDRHILHYTSKNLFDWKFCSKLELSSDKVIDACVFPLPGGGWRMWYKDEKHASHTWAADSDNLYDWKVVGEVIDDCAHEGANVFEFEGRYWMITDCWSGLGVYSSSDLTSWTPQESKILDKSGSRPDDGVIANHADVVVTSKGRAFIFYFTHPERDGRENANDRRSSVQVAELTVENGILCCDRDAEFDLELC